MNNFYALYEKDGKSVTPGEATQGSSKDSMADFDYLYRPDQHGVVWETRRRDVFRYEGYFEGGVWHPNENLPAEPATAPKPTELAPELAAVVPSRFVIIEDHPDGAYKGHIVTSTSRKADLEGAIRTAQGRTDVAATIYEAVAHVSATPEPVPQPERVVVRAG